MAFAIFILFTIAGVYTNGMSLVDKNKSIAFAGFDHLKEGAGALAEQDFGRAGLMFEGARVSFESLSEI